MQCARAGAATHWCCGNSSQRNRYDTAVPLMHHSVAPLSHTPATTLSCALSILLTSDMSDVKIAFRRPPKLSTSDTGATAASCSLPSRACAPWVRPLSAAAASCCGNRVVLWGGGTGVRGSPGEGAHKRPTSMSRGARGSMRWRSGLQPCLSRAPSLSDSPLLAPVLHTRLTPLSIPCPDAQQTQAPSKHTAPSADIACDRTCSSR